MGGRFALYSSGETIAAAFDLAEVPELQPRYNVVPSQPVAVIRTCPFSAPPTWDTCNGLRGLLGGWLCPREPDDRRRPEARPEAPRGRSGEPVAAHRSRAPNHR
jgi:putative SOS response-associated peptidase YedK